jgi:aerobic-type carbon monoxide dehydrogenase small subunit (CoxS/CutS family)
MGYWDYTPPSGGRPKPLTKAQIKKLQQAYSKAGEITESVKSLEAEEQEKTEKEIDEMMKGFI